jgi:ribosomal protein L11 methyltransferase
MSAESLLRLSMQLPTGWEETLLWQLAEDGWGAGVLEHRFLAGHLDDEPVGSAGTPEVVFVMAPNAVDEFIARMMELADLYQWSPEQWSYRKEQVCKDVWEAAWRKKWRAFRCGSFVIHADFHDLDLQSLRSNDLPLQVPTGSAFGTGGHPSTRIALRSLQRWWLECPFERVLDVGTGTGILAVASTLLGARVAMGMDPDPSSPFQAKKMAKLNGVAQKSHFWEGAFDSVGGKWEMILANLQSGLLQRYALRFSELLEEDGRLFVGGFMDKNQKRTLGRLEGAGLTLMRLHCHGRWRAAEFLKT